jgi:hypothetical protein
MNRTDFFEFLRSNKAPIFGKNLSPVQVDGIGAILDVWAAFFSQKYPVTFLAAALGQVFRETGGKMQPVLETFAKDRKQAAARLERAFVAGKLKWVKTRYWLPDESGQIAVGGGYIQETHRENYVKADARLLKWFGFDAGLSKDYDQILKPAISALAMFTGMIDGSYRKHKLADYVRGKSMDYRNARDIVNGDKKHVGKEIDLACRVFEAALIASGADVDFGPAENVIALPGNVLVTKKTPAKKTSTNGPEEIKPIEQTASDPEKKGVRKLLAAGAAAFFAGIAAAWTWISGLPCVLTGLSYFCN